MIDFHTRWLGYLRRLRARQQYGAASLACGLLLVLLGQFGGPLLAVRPCGLIAPHEHVFVGPHRDLDLQRHLAAEAACARGRPEPPDEQASDLRGLRGNLVNVPSSAQATGTLVPACHCLTADLPHAITIAPSHPLFASLEPVRWFYRLIALPPPNPPPEAA